MRLIDAYLRDVPDIQGLTDYGAHTDGQPEYVGFANINAADSDPVWVIHYFEYNAQGNETVRRSRRGAWSERATLFV